MTGSPSGGKTGAWALQVSWVYCAEAGARPGGGSGPLFQEVAWEGSHQDGACWSTKMADGGQPSRGWAWEEWTGLVRGGEPWYS